MNFVLFYHSLVSDWNHGNAHFLRGLVRELLHIGHSVEVYEPAHGWSLTNLLQSQGEGALAAFRAVYPGLHSRFYEENQLDVGRAIEDADVVLVHEWNTPKLIANVGRVAASLGVRAYFHDTHHRSVTDARAMSALDLTGYEGVLAFGETIAERYRENGWAKQVWVWHEAADIQVFQPHRATLEADLVWIGNWGDEERSEELHEFLIDPVATLGIEAQMFGVRYPQHALDALQRARIRYRGWIANHAAPHAYARHRCTVHVPRRVYREKLPGIPTIRMFEALACGIPLVSAPWDDAEHLFRPGKDYLLARNGREMRGHLRALLHCRELRESLVHHGLETICARHTCAHRARELLAIVGDCVPLTMRSGSRPTAGVAL